MMVSSVRETEIRQAALSMAVQAVAASGGGGSLPGTNKVILALARRFEAYILGTGADCVAGGLFEAHDHNFSRPTHAVIVGGREEDGYKVLRSDGLGDAPFIYFPLMPNAAPMSVRIVRHEDLEKLP